MIGAVLLVLVLAAVLNDRDDNRCNACVTVLWVTAIAYGVYESPWYFHIEDIFGYYGYESLTALLSIIILANIKCRLSTCLMVLFCVLISVNIAVWYAEFLGFYVEQIYQWVVWAIFTAELVLMLSPRVTNVVHGMVHRPQRDSGGAIVAFEHLDHCPEHNSSEAEK